MTRNISILAGSVATIVLVASASPRSAGTPLLVRAKSSMTNMEQSGLTPDFELKTPDGRVVKLSDFRGKVVVLNFWATWCTPCRVEMPWLNDFYRLYKDRDLEIIGVSMDSDEPGKVTDFVKEMKVNFTILIGNHKVSDLYGGTRLLPQTFFIGRDGHLISHTIGVKTRDDFEETIRTSLSALRH